MSTYVWRKNFTASYSNKENVVRGKLAFKTKTTAWLETKEPSIALVSIHSAFHEKISGDLKMNAFMSTIKEHVRGKVTVLLSDRAHLQTFSLNYQEDSEKAFKECLKSSQELIHRYKEYFSGCHIVSWHSYIYQDKSFYPYINIIKSLYRTSVEFQDLVRKDAESTYTVERMALFPDKELFLGKAVEDILEQCACILVLASKGYRFQFYPGSPFASTEYVNNVIIPDKQIFWIDVFLTVEKKTITPQIPISVNF